MKTRKTFNELVEKVHSLSPPSTTTAKHNRFWKPKLDASGTGSAIIRFLPCRQDEEWPFVQIWSHGFQEPNKKWLICNCLSTLSQSCPICEASTTLSQSARKRKLVYHSNILVVYDPKRPENNGKVFLYKYGVKIFDKLKDLMFPPPECPDVVPVDPYDMSTGANFKLRVCKVEGYPNYDKSTFDEPSAIGDDELIVDIESKLYSLTELLDPKHFDSHQTITERLRVAMAGPQTVDDKLVSKPKPRPKSKSERAEEKEEEDYFARLAAR